MSANGVAACRWCGALHGPLCPAVSALEFYEDGTVKSVMFRDPKPVIQHEENDDQYRRRLLQVVGRSSVNYAKVSEATGDQLDLIGSYYNSPRY